MNEWTSMADAISENLINDPVNLAIAVLVERIRGLSKVK
jgi:hypothetical protein